MSYTINPPAYRYRDRLPKIGIRPTIDGRQGGVRESLEEQTMAMAHAAKALFEGTLKHPSGHPVECVIADTTIGGVAEAAQCAEKFAREGVGLSLTVTPCWCYGSETMDMNPDTPKAIWGFNGTERPGAVYLAAVLAAHNQKGLPAFSIYGHDVLDAGDSANIPGDVREKLLRWARAGLAVAAMRGKSYLAIGSTSMGIAGSIPNPDLLEDYLGMRFEQADMSEFMRRLELDIFDKDEFEKALAYVKANCKEGEDPNEPSKQHDRARKDEVWAICVKMALIGRDLMIGNPKLAEMGFLEEARGHNAIAAGFQGQRQWTDFMPNGDFMEAMLCSSFDWNGIREPFIMATENDMLNGLSMLFGHLLNSGASIFADVRTYWSPEAIERVTGYAPEGAVSGGFIHLINSGAASLDGTGRCETDGKPAMKPFWEITSDEAAACVEATRFGYGNMGYFRGGGYSSTFLTRGGMPMTMMRLNYVKGLGPVMQLAEGWTADVPEHVYETINKRTDPTWPTTWFVPRVNGKGAFADVYSVMANWGANHGALSYGHIGADIIALCAMLRIPVAMHNVDDADIFRPTAWGAFGTKDLEGADYRACAAYGALYA